MGKEKALEIWDLLLQMFERKGVASQLYIRRQLLTLKYENDTSLEAHFVRFDELIRQLKSARAKLEKEDMVCHLLLTMPETNNNVVTAIETLSTDKLTIEFVKGRLLDEEAKKKNNGDNSYDKNQDNSAAFGTTSNSRFPFRRYGCDKVGHLRSECKFRSKLGKEKYNSNRKTFLKKSTANYVLGQNEDEIYFSLKTEKILSLLRSQTRYFGSFTLVVHII